MKKDLAIQIRRSLSRYLAGEQTLKQFLRTYLPKLSEVSAGQPEDEFVHEIYVRLAEFVNGDWTEQELKDVLRPLVSTYYVEWPNPGARVHTGTSTAPTRQATSMPAFVLVGG
jgi:hypothetical protein